MMSPNKGIMSCLRHSDLRAVCSAAYAGVEAVEKPQKSHFLAGKTPRSILK